MFRRHGSSANTKSSHDSKKKSRVKLGASVSPPVYPEKDMSLTFHEDTRVDPFYYFREKKYAAKVKSWLTQENAFMESQLKGMCEDVHDLVVEGSGVDGPSTTSATLPPGLDPDAFVNLEKTIFKEMRARWKESDASLPTRERKYWYFARTFEGEEHAVHCRAPYVDETKSLLLDFAELLKADPEAQLPTLPREEIIVDVNALQDELGIPYIDIGDMDVSPDESHLLLSVDASNGKEIFTILVLDLSASAEPSQKRKTSGGSATTSSTTGRMKTKRDETSDEHRQTAKKSKKEESKIHRPRHVHHVTRTIDMFPSSSEVLWHTDDAFFYFAMDDTQRPFRVVYHDMKQDVDVEAADTILFEESDPQFWVTSICFSDDERYIMFCTASKLSEEWWVMDAAAHVLTIVQQVHATSDVSPTTRSCASLAGDDPHKLLTDISITSPNSGTDVKTALFVPLQKRTPALEYEVCHVQNLCPDGDGAAWIVSSNRDQCRNFVVDYFVTPTLAPGHCAALVPHHWSEWKPLIQYDDSVKIDSVSCTKWFLLCNVRKNGFPAAFLAPMVLLQHAIRSACLPISLSDTEYFVNVLDLLPPIGDARHVRKEEECISDDRKEVFCVEAAHGSDDYDCDELRVYLQHMIFPAQVYLSTVNHQVLEEATARMAASASSSPPLLPSPKDFFSSPAALLRLEYVRGVDYSPSLYRVHRRWVPSSVDPHVKIPLTLCYRADTFRSGVNPCLITAYGSYGDPTDPEFHAERLSILDRGMVYAIAHVRGGGELGRVWRDSGRMEHRMNTFTDFVDCSKYLMDEGFCHKRRLVSLGGSAGGTVVAVAMLLAPELFGAVMPLVPFVDCLTTMLDPSIPLTTAEWEEWGNPVESKAAYDCIKSYSPMDNLYRLTTTDLSPPRPLHRLLPRFMFVESGLGDPRVPHWEPMAFVARLRKIAEAAAAAAAPETMSRDEEAAVPAAKEAGLVILHKCNLEAGHGGSSGRYEQLHELAAEYAFAVAAGYLSVR